MHADDLRAFFGPLTQLIEAGSVVYAEEWGFDRTPDWFALKLAEEAGELIQAHLMLTGGARSKGLTGGELHAKLGAEIADVICCALLLANLHRVDVGDEIAKKWLVRVRTRAELGLA